MSEPGPPLERLLRRLAECPDEFLQPPATKSGLSIGALTCDVLRDIAPTEPPELQRAALAAVLATPKLQQGLIAVACWILADEWFHGKATLAARIWRWLASTALADLSTVVSATAVVRDADRREEFVRLNLAELGLRPAGESKSQAADRLTMLNSVERVAVLRKTADAERRAREIREAMARKAALDAASRYGE